MTFFMAKKRQKTSEYEQDLAKHTSRADDEWPRLTSVLTEEEGDRGKQGDDGYEPNTTHDTPSALHSSGRLIHSHGRCECNLILLQRQGNARARQPTEKQENLRCTKNGVINHSPPHHKQGD